MCVCTSLLVLGTNDESELWQTVGLFFFQLGNKVSQGKQNTRMNSIQVVL